MKRRNNSWKKKGKDKKGKERYTYIHIFQSKNSRTALKRVCLVGFRFYPTLYVKENGTPMTDCVLCSACRPPHSEEPQFFHETPDASDNGGKRTDTSTRLESSKHPSSSAGNLSSFIINIIIIRRPPSSSDDPPPPLPPPPHP